MIRNVRLAVPTDPMIASIMGVVDKSRSFVSNARALAEAMFGDYMMTNMIMIGAAYQRGYLPISAASIETAIHMNKVAVEANIQAFRAGRLSIHDATRLSAAAILSPSTFADRVSELARRPNSVRRSTVERLMASMPALDAQTKKLLGKRIEDLIDYQDVAYATRYADNVRMAISAEQAGTGQFDIARDVIRNLHKLMAYKDEYEVARLLVQNTFAERVRVAFDPSAKFYYNLQPPLLRSFGLKGKVTLGGWFTPALRALSATRFLRGTAIDPFGYASVRRLERELVGWYENLLREILPMLTAESETVIRELVNLPEDIRGYEDLKVHSAAKARELAQSLMMSLRELMASRQAAE